MFTPDKHVAEKEYFWFDFSKALPEGVMIETDPDPVWTITPISGRDDDAAGMLEEGQPIFRNSALIGHLIVGGVAGVTYRISCRVYCDDGEELELTETLKVIV